MPKIIHWTIIQSAPSNSIEKYAKFLHWIQRGDLLRGVFIIGCQWGVPRVLCWTKRRWLNKGCWIKYDRMYSQNCLIQQVSSIKLLNSTISYGHRYTSTVHQIYYPLNSTENLHAIFVELSGANCIMVRKKKWSQTCWWIVVRISPWSRKQHHNELCILC